MRDALAYPAVAQRGLGALGLVIVDEAVLVGTPHPSCEHLWLTGAKPPAGRVQIDHLGLLPGAHSSPPGLWPAFSSSPATSALRVGRCAGTTALVLGSYWCASTVCQQINSSSTRRSTQTATKSSRTGASCSPVVSNSLRHLNSICFIGAPSSGASAPARVRSSGRNADVPGTTSNGSL